MATTRAKNRPCHSGESRNHHFEIGGAAEAHAEAEFEDGTIEALHAAHARGTQKRPHTDSDLQEKFAVALELGSVKDVESLIKLIMVGEDQPVGTLTDRLGHIGNTSADR